MYVQPVPSQHQSPNSGAFLCIKIALIVLYSLSLVGIIIILVFSIFALVVIDDSIAKETDNKKKEDFEFGKTILIISLVFSVLLLIFTIIGLVGAIKENGIIMITFTVFGVIWFISYAAMGSWASALLNIPTTVLTGIYGYMIIQKSRPNHVI